MEDNSAKKYYEEANEMLKNRDLDRFLLKIDIAELLSKTDKEMFAKIMFLKVKGLFSFCQYKKALENMPIAIEYNSGNELLRLKAYEGVMLGYLGETIKAEEIFLELIGEIEETEIEFLVEVYLNIIWVYLTLCEDPETHKIEEAYKYLKLSKNNFDDLPNRFKWKILNSFSVYYFFKNEYYKSIEMLENAIQYCEEKNLADIYTNLAELYMSLDKTEISVKAEEYLKKAEIIGAKYNDAISLGYTFYSRAEAEIREDQLFRALDTLSLSFEYFKEAGAYALLSDSVLKINQLMDKYKNYLQKFC